MIKQKHDGSADLIWKFAIQNKEEVLKGIFKRNFSFHNVPTGNNTE